MMPGEEGIEVDGSLTFHDNSTHWPFALCNPLPGRWLAAADGANLPTRPCTAEAVTGVGAPPPAWYFGPCSTVMRPMA